MTGHGGSIALEDEPMPVTLDCRREIGFAVNCRVAAGRKRGETDNHLRDLIGGTAQDVMAEWAYQVGGSIRERTEFLEVVRRAVERALRAQPAE